MELQTVEDVYNFYNEHKTEDEYFINLYGNKFHVNRYNLLDIEKNAIYKNKTFLYENGAIKIIVRNKTVKRLHPNHINNHNFWVNFKKSFPLVSVNGGYSKDVDDCNKRTFDYSESYGNISFIEEIVKSQEKVNLFEIGYGHGNLYEHFKNYKNVKYTGIDYYKIPKLRNIKNLKIITKSGIPNYIPDNSQDIIYSFNVLQHCSQKDRNDYFKQGFDKLKSGGYFIGGMFMVTDENKDKPYWGVEDLNGRKYCVFFKQLTEVDTMDEFYETITNIGYRIEKTQNHENWYNFILKKP